MPKHASTEVATAHLVTPLERDRVSVKDIRIRVEIGMNSGDRIYEETGGVIRGQLWERIEETAEMRLAALPARDREDLRERAAISLAPKNSKAYTVMRNFLGSVQALAFFEVEKPRVTPERNQHG